MSQWPTLGRRTLLLSVVSLAIPAAVGESAPAAAAGVDTSAKLTAKLNTYLTTRVGTVGLALMDSTGRTFGYSSLLPNETLSTIKVLVLIAHLRRCQALGTVLTYSQKSLASRMIRYSDNAATDQLIAQIGLTRMQQVARDLGMASTLVRAGSYGTNWWGYSVSTPADMLKLMHTAMWGRAYLTETNRLYIKGLMASVTATQRWGVCDPPLPTSTYTAVKNGWGPHTGGYRLNSIGYVNGNGRLYIMAISTRSPKGYSYGLTTINQVSTMVYDALGVPLA